MTSYNINSDTNPSNNFINNNYSNYDELENENRDKINYSYSQNLNQQENQEENDEFLNYEKLKKDYRLHFDDEEE